MGDCARKNMIMREDQGEKKTGINNSITLALFVVVDSFGGVGGFTYLEGQSQGNAQTTHLEQGNGLTTDIVVGYYGDQEPAAEVQEFGNGWDVDLHNTQAMSNNHHQQQQQEHLDFYQNNNARGFDSAVLPAEALYNPTPDLLNLFHLLPGGHTDASWLSSSGLYDPLFRPGQVSEQPPIVKELFQSLPLHGHYDGIFLFFIIGGDEGVGGGIVYGEDSGDARKYEKRLLDFGQDIDACIVKRKKVKLTEHYTTERDRRTQLNQKYDTLKSLIPNPTKSDRASVVGDAIDYIQELKRTVNELRLLAERKRRGKQRNRRLPNEHSDRVGDVDGESTITNLPLSEPDRLSNNGTLRTSWLQRKSKVTVLDVRIIDDEVTVKIMQRKRINCLLHVARVLDDLQLDLHHVAGGHVGEHFSSSFSDPRRLFGPCECHSKQSHGECRRSELNHLT